MPSHPHIWPPGPLEAGPSIGAPLRPPWVPWAHGIPRVSVGHPLYKDRTWLGRVAGSAPPSSGQETAASKAQGRCKQGIILGNSSIERSVSLLAMAHDGPTAVLLGAATWAPRLLSRAGSGALVPYGTRWMLRSEQGLIAAGQAWPEHGVTVLRPAWLLRPTTCRGERLPRNHLSCATRELCTTHVSCLGNLGGAARAMPLLKGMGILDQIPGQRPLHESTCRATTMDLIVDETMYLRLSWRI